mgnify:CR=1 FL=1
MIEGPRAAKPGELVEIIRLANSIFLPNHPMMMRDLFPQLFSEDNLENLRVISYDGKIISHVGIWEGDLLIYGCWFKVGMIGSVCTHPKYRGRGFASTLVKDALSKMMKDDVDFTLVSGFRNLYIRAGCVEAGRIYTYEISSGGLKLKLNRINIVRYEENLLNDLVEIYQKEPIRYKRSFEEFKILAGRGFLRSDMKLRILIAKNRGVPLAYIATGLLPNEETPSVVEYAGSREAILYLVSELLNNSYTNAIRLSVPHQDSEMLYLLERYGFKKTMSEAHASISIINSESFLDKVETLLREKMPDRKVQQFISNLIHGKLRLYLNGKKTDFQDPQVLTLLFFGSPEKIKFPRRIKLEIKPIPEYLSDVLPLPTPIYGLNYI